MNTMHSNLYYVMFVPANHWQRHGLSSLFPER